MALPLAIVLALALAACGSDNDSSSASSKSSSKISCAPGASVDGAGSTFVATIVQQWVKDYQAACPGTTVNYKGGGSGAGVQQFTAGTVAFAGTDVPLTDKEKTAAEAKYGAGNLVEVPWSAGGIALEYNLSGVTDLKLSAENIAKIFAGKITKWNDPAIVADNGSAKLPTSNIQVVHRSDGSGTTAAFASYMTAVDPADWTAGTAKDLSFPVGQGAKGSDGVSTAVKQTDGSIGYAEVSYAKAQSVSMASVKNAAGKFVSPSDTSAVGSALAAASVNADGTVKLNYTTTDEKAYPISTVTYLVTAKSATASPQRTLVQSFVLYALGGGQSSADALSYSQLPDAIDTPATSAAAKIAAA